MLDVNKNLVSKLKTDTGLGVHYELFPKKYTMPCITYMPYDNYETNTGDTLAYSSIAYYIKLWGKNHEELMPYMAIVDASMRELGYKRESYNELAIANDLCLIAQYRALGKEEIERS